MVPMSWFRTGGTSNFDANLKGQSGFKKFFSTFWGPNRLFFGLGKGPKTVLGSTHVVKQLSFSLFLSILTFDFDSIFGSFLTFWGPNGLFLGLGKGPKTVLGPF